MTRNELPAIKLRPADLSRLDLLTGRLPAYRGAARRLLARELARARVLSSAEPPPDLVTMHATVRFRDDAERIETAALVYPGEETDGAGRISVVTPRGAALIGLSEGQSIAYEADDGRAGRLTVLQVLAQAEADGKEHAS
jgi:regulator of nucleoside diphosphate kinase